MRTIDIGSPRLPRGRCSLALIWRTRRTRVLGLLAALLLAILLLRWVPTQASWDGIQHIAHGVAWRFADRRWSPPLATGDGWRAYADHICDETGCDIQASPASVFPGQVVFIKIDVAEWYLSSVAPRIAAPHIVVSHNGDNPFTRRLAGLLDRTPRVTAWFAQNIELDAWHPRLLSIPIGLEDRPYALGSCPTLYARLPTFANLLRPPTPAGGLSSAVGQPAPGGPFAFGWALAGALDAGSAAVLLAGRQSRRELPETAGVDASDARTLEGRSLAATAQHAASGSPAWHAAASALVRPSTKVVYAAFNVATNAAERQRAASALAQLPCVSYHMGGATVPPDAPALLTEAAAAADAAAALDGALEVLLLRLAEWRLDVVDPPSPLDARSAAAAAAAELRAAGAATTPAGGGAAARRTSVSAVAATRSVVTEALKGCGASAGQVDQSSRNFAAIAGHPFVASPPGNGLQAHRTWEALIGGSVPVVLRSGGAPGRPLPYHAMDGLYTGLPVLLVGDWGELSQELLLGALLRLGHVMNNTLLLRQCASLLGQSKRASHTDGATESASERLLPHLRLTGKAGSGGHPAAGGDAGRRRAELLASCLHRGYLIHAPDASAAEPAAAAAHSAPGLVLVPPPDFDPLLLATPPERLTAPERQQLSRAVFRFERIYGAHWLSVIDAARWEATALGAGWYAAEASA